MITIGLLITLITIVSFVWTKAGQKVVPYRLQNDKSYLEWWNKQGAPGHWTDPRYDWTSPTYATAREDRYLKGQQYPALRGKWIQPPDGRDAAIAKARLLGLIALIAAWLKVRAERHRQQMVEYAAKLSAQAKSIDEARRIREALVAQELANLDQFDPFRDILDLPSEEVVVPDPKELDVAAKSTTRVTTGTKSSYLDRLDKKAALYKQDLELQDLEKAVADLDKLLDAEKIEFNQSKEKLDKQVAELAKWDTVFTPPRSDNRYHCELCNTYHKPLEGHSVYHKSLKTPKESWYE